MRNGIRVVGIGAAGVALIDAHGATLRRLLAKWAGQPLKQSFSDGEASIVETIMDPIAKRRPKMTYVIRRLMIERSKDLFHERLERRPGDPTDLDMPLPHRPGETLRDYIRGRIVAGLARQAEWLDANSAPCPAATQYGGRLDLRGRIEDFEIVGVRKFARDVVSGHAAKATVLSTLAVDLVFRAPFRIVGPWSVGRLAARGYGEIRNIATQDARSRLSMGSRSGVRSLVDAVAADDAAYGDAELEGV